MKGKLTRGLLLGCLFIMIAIAIAVFFQHDIGFIFAGIGTIIIGITFLAYINKDENNNKKDGN